MLTVPTRAARVGCLLAILTSTVLADESAPAAGESASAAAGATKKAFEKATAYFTAAQNPDGGYGPIGEDARIEGSSDVGITALAVYALARQPRDVRRVDTPAVTKAVKFLLSKQQPDGGFYDPRDPVLRNYRTSITVMALSALDEDGYGEVLGKARDYIASLQLDESGGYARDEHVAYGAFKYGDGDNTTRGDLSNSGWAADALRESGVSASAPLWRKLEVFTSRCQNAPKVDSLLTRGKVGTTGDWGFHYRPDDTRGPSDSLDGDRVFASYGSMTYQGLKTLLYAGVDRDDPRVVNAFRWISKHFTVTENPGMATPENPALGQQGLYYYYHTMAKALAAYGESEVTDAKGARHRWAVELRDRLLETQHEDGYWLNESDRWWEDIAELDTAFATVALAICEEQIRRDTDATSTR